MKHCITGTTDADQTKAAFLLPKQDRGDDPFTTEKLLKVLQMLVKVYLKLKQY